MSSSYDELLQQKTRLELFSSATIRLSQSIQIQNLEWMASLELVCKTVSQTLRVQRVGVWTFLDDCKRLKSEKIYEKGLGFSSGIEIDSQTYPKYFEGILSRKIICANDVFTHPHTTELIEDYLSKLKIKSLLDLAFYVDAKIAGVICCESIESREWDTSEINFAQSMTDVALLAYKLSERKKDQLKIQKQKELLEQQAIELSAREEELRQNMDELIATQDLLSRQLENESLRSTKSRLLTSLSQKLIQSDFFETLPDILKSISESSGYDRSYLYLKKGDKYYCVCEFSFDKPQNPEHFENGIKTKTLEWLLKELKNNYSVRIENLEQIPPEGYPFYELLKKDHVFSVLIFPIWVEGELEGFIGYDAIQSSINWSDIEIDILKILSEIVSAAYSQHVATRKLSRRNALENQIFELSQLIYKIPLSQWLKHLDKVLSQHLISLYDRELKRIGGSSVALFAEQEQVIEDLFASQATQLALKDEDSYFNAVAVKVNSNTRFVLTSLSRHNLQEEEFFFFNSAARVLSYYFEKMDYEAELKAAKEKAEEATLAKSRFLANMSHEIRTPMNAVLGFADLLAESISDPKHFSYIQAIKSGGKTLLGIINDILDISKIEAGKLTLEYCPVHLGALLREVEQFFSLKISQKGLKFFITSQSGLPEILVLDEARLKQILLNLVSNSIKFTEKGSVILSIGFDNLNQTSLDLWIEVVDTGIGILKSEQEMIFEPFSQSHSTQTKKFGGTGLGLSISKKLVSMMNGSISVESELGKGSTFKVVLPGVKISNEDKKAEQSHQNDSFLPDFQTKTILVVDDVPTNRTLVVEYLKPTFCKIVEASNGVEAVEFARKYQPDLILMDIRMPVMDGIQATHLIKSDKTVQHIAIIALTASALSMDRDRIMEHGFNGFLTKPLKKIDLYHELNSHLSNQSPTALPTVSSAEIKFDQVEVIDLPEEIFHRWEKVSRNCFVDEIAEFAKTLLDWTQQQNYESGQVFANELLTAANNFDIVGMTKHLDNFLRVFARK